MQANREIQGLRSFISQTKNHAGNKEREKSRHQYFDFGKPVEHTRQQLQARTPRDFARGRCLFEKVREGVKSAARDQGSQASIDLAQSSKERPSKNQFLQECDDGSSQARRSSLGEQSGGGKVRLHCPGAAENRQQSDKS